MNQNSSKIELIRAVWADARPCIISKKCTVVHICSKLSAHNARLCKICTASHVFLQLLSNYARLCTYARPAVHDPWPPISSLLVFPRLFNPLSFLNHNYLLIIKALSSRFFDFGSIYLTRVGLAPNNTIMSARE